MRVTAALMIFSVLGFGQCTVLLQPYPLAATQRIFANGREAGLWHIVLRNHTNANCAVSRQDIETMAPAVAFFPNDLALDLLTRKANLSRWSLFARYGKLALELAPVGLSMYGAVSGVNGFTIGGAGGSVLQFVVSRTAADAPNPAQYTSQFCGSQVKLASGEGLECYMAAGLVHDVKPIGPVEIQQIPPAPPPGASFRIPTFTPMWKSPRLSESGWEVVQIIEIGLEHL